VQWFRKRRAGLSATAGLSCLDYRKAFDSVPHICRKIENVWTQYEIRGVDNGISEGQTNESKGARKFFDVG